MSWNIRVIEYDRRKHPNVQPKYGFVETHYNDEGKVYLYGDVFMVGDNEQELQETINRLQKALSQPFIKQSQFKEKEDGLK